MINEMELEADPQQPPPAPTAGKTQWKSDGHQWVAQDGSGRTRPISVDDAIDALPAPWRGTARQLQKYSIPYPSAQLAREAAKGGVGPWSHLVQAVSLDPTWSAENWDGKRKTIMDFASGSQTSPAANKTALNTAIGHLAKYSAAAHKLNNISIPLIGKPINAAINYAIEGSDPRVNTLGMAQNALASEMTRAFRGASGTEGDIESWKKALSLNTGENVQAESAKTAVELMASRIRSLRRMYTNSVKREPDFPFLDPDSREILKRLGYDPDAVESGEYGKKDGVGEPDESTVNPPVAKPSGAWKVIGVK